MLPKVIADHRESHFVVPALRKLKAEVIEKSISPGDYVVGEGLTNRGTKISEFLDEKYLTRT